MIKIEIKRDGTVTNAGEFENQELGDAWLSHHTTNGTFGEGFTIVTEDLTAKLEQEKANAEAQAFLDFTDWLIIRELDSGEPCPIEIKEARAEARAKIQK